MFKISKKKFYIILFSILWLITAFSSFFHAVEFFELSNVTWMGVILALAFEIGQASTLMSILTSKQNQKKYTPWILMCILTLVQIIGNVYSSYKYIMLNSPENLKYFKEPIFIWTQLPDDQATVIVTYVSAAILPIVALLMTAMITNYLSEQEELELGEEVGEIEDNEELEDNDLNVELEKKDEEIEKLKKDLKNERSLYGDIAEEFPKATKELSKKDEEIEKLRQELEELKQSKENAGIEEEETLRDNGSNDSIQQENEDVEESASEENKNDVEDSIEHIEEPNRQESDTGETEVEETKLEDNNSESISKDYKKRESHFINL